MLDNADDPNVDYQRYFPAGPSGVVILTSRSHHCQQYGTTKYVPLEGLSEVAACELLFKAAKIADDNRPTLRDDAHEVAVLLKSHPLALIQAGAYVGKGHCTFLKYPYVYSQQRKRLLEFRPNQAQSRYGDVYTTFEASAAALRATNSEAVQDALVLLPILAAYGPSRLPLPLFEAAWEGARRVSLNVFPSTNDDHLMPRLTAWHVAHLPSLIPTGAKMWDSFRLVEAVDLLKAFSLVSTDNYDGYSSVSMHGLVHAWARDRQNTSEQHVAWLRAGCLIALSYDDDLLWRKQARQLQSHLQAVMSWEMSTIFGSEPAQMVAYALTRCGALLNEMRDDAILSALLQRLFTYFGLDRLTVDARWLGLYHLSGLHLFNYGKIKEAVVVLKEVVRIKTQTLAEDHPSRLASQHELARAYKANGQVKEAVVLLEEVVGIEAQTLAEDHPSRLASQHELAGVYEANGQVKEAVVLLEEVVRIRAQTLAEDHPERLASQHELARVYEANGQVKEAVVLLEEVVGIRAQTLAEDHPERLASQHELARVYEANGQVKEAVVLLEEVVRIQAQTLAEDHPDRLTSQQVLAGVYRANGQVKEAVVLLEEVVRIRAQTLAEDHPDRLMSQHELARVYRANGQVKEAVVLLEEVVRIQAQTLAEDHPDRLMSQYELARVYEANGQVKEAVVLLEEVVRIRAQTLAEDHPDRLTSQHNLAVLFWKLGRCQEALEMMRHVVRTQEHVFDEHHPERENSEDWLKIFEREMESESSEDWLEDVEQEVENRKSSGGIQP